MWQTDALLAAAFLPRDERQQVGVGAVFVKGVGCIESYRVRNDTGSGSDSGVSGEHHGNHASNRKIVLGKHLWLLFQFQSFARQS